MAASQTQQRFKSSTQKTLHLPEPRYGTATPITDDTIEGLAHKPGVNVHTFLETIRDFNTANKPGVFDPFMLDGLATDASLAIPTSNRALPITEAPFVAYGITCGIAFTYGGLKTDAQAKVMNNEGLPMPELWVVGEISGGFFAFNCPGGAGLTKGAVFGRIAGEAAAWRTHATDQANGTM